MICGCRVLDTLDTCLPCGFISNSINLIELMIVLISVLYMQVSTVHIVVLNLVLS